MADLRLYEVADRDKVELAHEFWSGKHVELSPTADGKICLSSMIYLLLIAAKLLATGFTAHIRRFPINGLFNSPALHDQAVWVVWFPRCQFSSTESTMCNDSRWAAPPTARGPAPGHILCVERLVRGREDSCLHVLPPIV
jgi:hypothetical protein